MNGDNDKKNIGLKELALKVYQIEEKIIHLQNKLENLFKQRRIHINELNGMLVEKAVKEISAPISKTNTSFNEPSFKLGDDEEPF